MDLEFCRKAALLSVRGTQNEENAIFSVPYHFLMARWSLTRTVWQRRAAGRLQRSR